MTPTEAKLLDPLKEEIIRLFAIQCAFPAFSAPFVDALLTSGVKSIALAVVTGERMGGQTSDLRSRQLEHFLAMLSEVYSEELKYLDAHPEFVEKVLSDGGELKSLLERIDKKAS